MSPLAISLRFLQTQPDQRLAQLARAGHERAFEALVRRYRGALLAYSRRVAPHGASSEDILQQALLQAWGALSRGAEVRDVRAWLYRIVHNVAISSFRASAEAAVEGLTAEAGVPGVEQLVEQRMAAREALAGLAALPDLQRQVMVSTALDGASHEEVAATLGLSSGSVRGLVYRARSTLRAAAAAVMPAPVIEWALGDVGSTSMGLAGAGSAGLGALLLKGGAIIAVGAVAGTTAVVVGDHAHHAPHPRAAAVASSGQQRVERDASLTATARVARIRLSAAALHNTKATPAVRAASVGRSSSAPVPSRGRGGSQDGHGSRTTVSGGGGGSGRDAGSGGDGGSGGSAGSSPAQASSSGSDGGGEHQATTGSSGSDGGGALPTSTVPLGSDGAATTASSDGGSSGGGSSGGSSSGGGSSGGGSSGGGSSDGRQLSGSDGGPSTATTTTTTTNH